MTPPKTLGQISKELSGPVDNSYIQDNNKPKRLGEIASDLSGFTGESEPITSKQETRYTPDEEEAFKIHDVDTRPQAGDPFEQLGQNQSNWDKVGNGAVRLLGTTATKLGSGIGYIGGFGAWAANGFSDISAMTDNAWSETFNNWEKSLKSNVPIYTPTSVSQGGILDKMASTSFWMDQGVDGVAYMLSALVPGLALSKAAKFGVLAAGLAEGAEATTTASKIATYGNTILSTISEAAQEAKGVQDHIRESYKTKILNGEISPEDVELKAAEAAKNDFMWNAGILLVPNFIENRFFFGKLGSEKKLAEKIIDSTTGELIDSSSEVINSYTKKNLAKNIIKNIGVGIASEGLWEENVQLSIQNYYQNLAEGKIKKEDEGAVKNIAKGLYNNLFTAEGQESIVLGGLLGAIGGGVGAVRETSEEKAILNNIQSDFKDNIGVRKDILKEALKNKYIKNEDGTIKLDESGKPVRNVAKIREALSALTQGKRLEDLKKAANLAGDETLVDVIEDAQFTGFVTSLLRHDEGLDLVNKQIDTLVDQGMQEFTDPNDKVKLAQVKQEYKERAKKVAEINDIVSDNIKSWKLVGGKKSTDKQLSDVAIFLDRHKINTIIEGSKAELIKKKLLTKKQEQYLLLNKELLEKLGEEGFVDTRTEIDKQKSEQLEKDIKELTGALKDSNERYIQLSDKNIAQPLFEAYLERIKKDEDLQEEVDTTTKEAEEAEKQRLVKLAEEQRLAKEKKEKLNYIDNQLEQLKFQRDKESIKKYESLKEERKTIEDPNYLTDKKKNEDHLSHNNLTIDSKVDYNGSEYTIESLDIGENKAVIKKNKTKVTLKITDLKPFKELNKDDLQTIVSEFINEPEANIANEATATNQVAYIINERTDPIIPNIEGKTVAKKSGVLMYKQFEHIFSTFIKDGIKNRVFSWRRDEEGLPIVLNTTNVNTDLLNSQTDLLPDAKVEYRIVELDPISKEYNDLVIQESIDNIIKQISSGDNPGYTEEDNYGFGNGEAIGIYKDEELVGFYQLPHAIPNEGDFFDYIESRDKIIKERKEIINNLKKGKVFTTISEKGNGNLYNKLTPDGKIDVYKNNDLNSYINVFKDDIVREQDKVNGRPVFIVSNGDYLVLPDIELTGTKRENETILEDIKNSINNFPKWGKKGQPFMLVKTANNTWYPTPVYSTPINEAVADKIVDKLKEVQNTRELLTIVQALQPYVFVKISKSGPIKIYENEDGEIILKVATKEFKVANMNYDEFKETLIKNKIKQNINLKDINTASGQIRMSENGTLTTNIKQFNGQYLVQPYIELNSIADKSIQNRPKLVKDNILEVESSSGTIVEDIEAKKDLVPESEKEVQPIVDEDNLDKQDLEDKKADIEKANLLQNEFSLIEGTSSKDLLTKIFKFFNKNFKWDIDNLNIHKEDGGYFTVIFTNGLKFSTTKGYGVSVLAGSKYMHFTPLTDFINAKYDAELKALEENKEESSTEEDSIEDLVKKAKEQRAKEIEEAKKRLEGKGFKEEDNTDFKTPDNKKSKKIDLGLEFKHIEKILPGFTKEEVKLIQDLRGNLQWGSYKDGHIKVMTLSPQGTAYHEAFHGVVDMLSDKDKEELFKEAESKYKVLDRKLLEEYLADDFGIYTSELTYEKSLIKEGWNKIVNFFKGILEFFNLYNRHGESKIDKLFYEINKGNFSDKSASSNTEERYSIIPGVSSATKLEFIQTIGNEFLKQYFDLKNKGVSSKEISVNDIYNNIKKLYEDKFISLSKADNPDMKQVGLLNNIINNWNLYRENTNKYLKSAGLKVGKEIKYESIIDEEGKLDDLQTDPENLETHELGSEREKVFRDTNEIDGFTHASTRLKLFLTGIPQIDLETGKPKVNIFNQPLYENMADLYYFIERNLVGIYNFNDQLEELKFLTKYKPELQFVTDKLEKGWEGINSDELLNLQNDFKTNFSKQQMAYLMVTFSSDPKTGAITYKTFESNRRTLRAEIEEQWKNNLLISNNDTVVDFENGEVVQRTGTKEAKKLKDNWDKVLKSLEKPNSKLSKFDLSSILKKLGIIINENTANVISSSKDQIIISSITNLINYFNKEELTKEDEKLYTDAIKVIAEAEVKSNPTKYSSSFVNGEMKNIYTVQLPSYASKLLIKLGNTNKVVFNELIEELQKDPSYQHINLLDELLENEEFRKNGFKMFFLDSMKDSDSKSEGSKFTKMSDKDFYVAQLALFQNLDGTSKTILKKKTAKYTYLTPADKQELMIFDAPVYETIINTDGEVDSKSSIISKFYNVVLSEAARIQQQLEVKKKVENKELDKSVLLKNYHNNSDDINKFDGRAFKFQIFESLNKEIYNDIVKALESNISVEEALLPIKNSIIETFRNELNSNLKDAYNEALDKEIIEVDKDNHFVNKSIDINSKEFTTRDSKDHQIKQLVGNFFLNSYLFNVEMSKLLNGDPAIYKDLFKRTYQSGSKTKFGNMGKSIINTLIVKDYTHRSELLNDENFLESISKLSEADQEYIKKEFAKTNVTDAQSWISPSLWKSILLASAEWSKDHQDLYDIMEGTVDMPKIFPERFRGLIKAVKPFYYGHRFNKDINIIQHEQVKTSMMPLFNTFVSTSPLLKEHRRKMDELGVDMVAFESTFKAAMPYRENVREPVYKDKHIVPLDSNNFGIQVDNPDHSYESENSSMRQLKMQLPGNIPSDLQFEDGRTGREVRDEILKLEASIVSDASKKLLNDVLTDERKFNELMKEALTSRNSTENIEKLLEIQANGQFKNNIALGPFIKDIEYLISSIWTKKVIKQAFEGGNLVQATSFGFRFKNLKDQQKVVDAEQDLKDIQSRLKHIKPTKGKTEYAEAVMPAWTRDFFNKDGYLKDINEIPEELREMIIYRIPTEGYHSMLPVKVVDFLPEGYGNFMLLPYEITTQFGADFDFDKVFFALSSHEVSKDGKISKIGYDNTKSISENTKKQRNNRILDLYKEVLRHPDIFKYMIKPSGFKKQEENKAKLKSQINTIKKERGESIEDPNYYSPIQQRNLKTRNHINIALKAKAANDVSGHAYTVILGLRLSEDFGEIYFNNQGKRDLSKVINYEGDMIGDELGSNLAAVLDDLKNPILAYLNINNTTINLLNTIIRLDFNLETGVDFITQPSIVELAINLDKNKRQQKDSKQGFYSLDSTISDYQNRQREVEKLLGEDKVEELKSKFTTIDDTTNLNSKDLNKWRQYRLKLGDKVNLFTLENLNENPDILEYYEYQNKVLEQYKKINSVKDVLIKLNRLFGVNNAAGPGYEDILDREEILNEIEESKIFESNIYSYGSFDIRKNEALNAYFNANMDTLEVFNKYLPYNNSMYRDLKRGLASKQAKNLRTLYIKPEIRDKFNRFINGALLHQHFGTEIKDIEFLFNMLPAILNEIKRSDNKQLKNNPLIQELDSFKKDGLSYINLRSNTYLPFIKDSISEGWLSLYNNDKTKAFARDLVKYSLFASNMYTGTRSFHNMIPVEILQQEGLNEFMDQVKYSLDNNIEILDTEQKERLQDQFIRNNAKLMTKVINPEIFTFEGELAITNETKIDVKSQRDNMILMEEISEDDSRIVYYTQYIRIYNDANKKAVLYKYNRKKSTINKIVYEKVATLGKSGYLIELDLNNDLKNSIIESNNQGVVNEVEEESPNEESYREGEDNFEDEGTSLNNLLSDAQKLQTNLESDIFARIQEKDPQITKEVWDKLSKEEKQRIIDCL